MVKELSKEQQEYLAKLEQIRSDYKKIFSTEEGKRVLDDLGKKCYVVRTTFARDEGNMGGIAFREGQRSVYLHIVNMQDLNVESTRQALKKQNEESDKN